jgi:hypothetical protein
MALSRATRAKMLQREALRPCGATEGACFQGTAGSSRSLWFSFFDPAKQLPETRAMGDGKMRIILRLPSGLHDILLTAVFRQTAG